MTQEELKELLFTAIKSAYKGGLEILDVYDSEFAVELKDDNSPLTEADKRAHLAIMDGLMETKIPVLSEEGQSIPFEERSVWANLWIVDPLDGTKEFVKRNGEFTVNIALINEGNPIIGVIYVPVTKVMYFGMSGLGSYKIEAYDELHGANTIEILLEAGAELPLDQDERVYTVVGSRSHMSPETEAFINEAKEEYGDIDIISRGSSLKLCMVAEGIADAYPRFAPTMEWDTAAGQGIVNAMGGQVIDQTTQKEMVYNRENLLNNWFLVTK